MADTGRTVWADLFWADGFWAAGFWSGDDTPVPTPTPDQPTGGFFLGFDHALAKRNRRKKELEDQKREQEEIEDAQAREIAKLISEQEAKDAEREDMARLQALADQFARKGVEVPRPMLASVLKASEERTKASLEQMRRQAERMLDEEEFALIVALMLDD